MAYEFDSIGAGLPTGPVGPAMVRGFKTGSSGRKVGIAHMVVATKLNAKAQPSIHVRWRS